ncbi:MAG: TldD/PmbA family protein [Gemmatimonadetes bacterium]|jgi:predicted Zn-dependent protease|nr:TldD/PmbA family protein [Gemmatimonadota bacterium]
MPARSLYAIAPHLSRAECEAITKKVLGYSTADECRVTVNSGMRQNTRFAVNQISTAGDDYNAAVTIRAVIGKRVANVTVNRLDDASLRAAVQNAERIARLAPEDPELLPELGPQQYQEAINWSDATASLEPEARADAVRAITEPARRAGFISTGYIEANANSFAIANSKGLFAYSRNTSTAFTTTVRTPDGTGSGWAGASDNDWRRIDPRLLAERAIEKARRSVNPVAIEPGRYTVVLEPTAVANLVQLISGAVNARGADEGRSFFSKAGGGNKIGEKVVDERVTLVSDPLDPRVPANTFGGDGMPTQKVTWIENGVVKNLAYDRFWAQKTGKAPVNAGGTLAMQGGTKSIEELVAGTERGILVTRFWYIRGVDPRTILFTGLTRDGTFLIENGKVTRPVKNLRYNESPIFMLNNLMDMGRPERVSASESGGPGQAIIVPPLKCRDFNFTSTSDAI